MSGLGFLGALAAFFGIRKLTEAVPPVVCTPGKRACSVDLGYAGKDLYECSSECIWVLIEANSPTCGWVPGEAEFAVTDLIIEPAVVYVGEPVSISVLVTNIGTKKGTKTLTLDVT